MCAQIIEVVLGHSVLDSPIQGRVSEVLGIAEYFPISTDAPPRGVSARWNDLGGGGLSDGRLGWRSVRDPFERQVVEGHPSGLH